MAGTKLCVDCKQEFPVNEQDHLVVPYFDMHSATCERCGKPLNIEYTADGRMNYGCPGHIGGSGPALYGYSEKYCPQCREERRNGRSVPCCVCRQKKGPALNTYREYTLWGGGTAIRLYCNSGVCEKAFLELPASQQAFYIRARCDLAFPSGQVIYALVDPESHLVRNVGRTYHPKRRLAEHLRNHHDELIIGINEKPYYTRANWIRDLQVKGLRPTMEILRELEIAPTAIEWERRYILHGIQQGWPLLNIETTSDVLVAQARASRLDFLHCSFESLVHENFLHEKGIEAFVHAYYR